MELDEARKAARAVLRRVDEGHDPAQDKADLRAAWTVQQAADAYLGSPDFARKAEKSQLGDRATLRNPRCCERWISW